MTDSTTPWTVAHQAPLSMGFSRHKHWSGLPCPSPGLGLGFPTQRVSQKGVCVCVNRSVVSDSFATVWTVAHQAPLSMGFSRQEHRSGLPCPPPGDLSNPVIEPVSLTSPALADRFFTTNATWEAHEAYFRNLKTRLPLIPGWNLTFLLHGCLISSLC